MFVFRKLVSEKPLFKLSCVCLSLGKLVNEKYFPVNGKHFLVKEKFYLVYKKVFSFYFGRKILFRSYEKKKKYNVFADYIKFDPQTFNCYIFCFESFFFQFLPLKFDLI